VLDEVRAAVAGGPRYRLAMDTTSRRLAPIIASRCRGSEPLASVSCAQTRTNAAGARPVLRHIVSRRLLSAPRSAASPAASSSARMRAMPSAVAWSERQNAEQEVNRVLAGAGAAGRRRARARA